MVVDVVLTVRVEVTVPEPETIAVTGLRVQVAGLVAPEGPVTAQASATLPVKPPDGATEIVEVLPVVAPPVRLRVVGDALRVKVGVATAVTVTVTVVVGVRLPDVPVTVTV